MRRFGITDRFSFLIITLFYCSTLTFGYFLLKDYNPKSVVSKQTKKLVHLVLIEFKDDISNSTLNTIEDAAYGLQQIPGVNSLHFGTNVSPEGLDKGYTHSLTMKFSNSEDRDSIYLPHPIHQKFVTLFVPHTESVLVYDFWE
ncbi:MAG: Dabb family protein [Flavobacteriaceae bacterium]|jgi:hypothetical protein